MAGGRTRGRITELPALTFDSADIRQLNEEFDHANRFLFGAEHATNAFWDAPRVIREIPGNPFDAWSLTVEGNLIRGLALLADPEFPDDGEDGDSMRELYPDAERMADELRRLREAREAAMGCAYTLELGMHEGLAEGAVFRHAATAMDVYASAVDETDLVDVFQGEWKEERLRITRAALADMFVENGVRRPRRLMESGQAFLPRLGPMDAELEASALPALGGDDLGV